ncbi:MAG: hypothetical protein EOM25_03945 [Deltaproteobacteria bacterium]|nr:hypothetical protein [Deltaproteobacteria bacterium]
MIWWITLGGFAFGCVVMFAIMQHDRGFDPEKPPDDLPDGHNRQGNQNDTEARPTKEIDPKKKP